MCGRVFCVLGDDDIVAAVAGSSSAVGPAHRLNWRQRDSYGPARNAGPTMVLPCVTAVETTAVAAADQPTPTTSTGAGEEGRDVKAGHGAAPLQQPATSTSISVQSMAWGFPRSGGDKGAAAAHLRDADDAAHASALLINARAESALSTPTWSRAINAPGGRCALIANGYYEWKRPPKGSRALSAPYYVSRADGVPLALAALSREPDTAATLSAAGLRRFAVLTTDPPANLAFLHDRAPLLLPTPDALRAWLHPRGGRITPSGLAALEGPAAVAGWPPLKAIPVTTAVGKISYQGADCAVDVRSRKGSIASLFAAKAGGGQKKRVKEEEGGGGGGATPAVSASPPPAPPPKKVKGEKKSEKNCV